LGIGLSLTLLLLQPRELASAGREGAETQAELEVPLFAWTDEKDARCGIGAVGATHATLGSNSLLSVPDVAAVGMDPLCPLRVKRTGTEPVGGLDPFTRSLPRCMRVSESA
jgi:hypothetical protein